MDRTLNAERVASVVFLGTPKATGSDLAALRLQTDGAVARYRADLKRLDRPAGDAAEFESRTAIFLNQLGRLTEIRQGVDGRSVSRLRVAQDFVSIFDSLHTLYDTLVVFEDHRLSRSTDASIDGGRAIERIVRESVLVTSAALNGGVMTPGERTAFVQAVGEQRQLWGLERSLLPDDLYGGQLEKFFSGVEYGRFRALEDLIVAKPNGPMPVDPVEWGTTVKTVLDSLSAAHLELSEVTGAEGDALGDRVLLRAGLIGGVGLVAVLISILLSVRFARALLGELVRLRDDARELAVNRLPNLVARLRAGVEVNVAAETPLRHANRIKEVGEVAEAFAATQQTAVAAAVGEAELRQGTSKIFMNIARRSQSLLQRQLIMLDELESRADADDLSDLFKLDHLTTRMRRHSESLIILSGAVPARGWKQPVRIIDVLRAAIAEIEHYTRVSVVRTADDGVSGSVATDVIHLLAELIENATAFSPPDTEVVVSAGQVGNGCVVEIEDRGLGMTPQAFQEINARLANPPEIDFVDTDQLGLFVAARLAARHQIKVMLRPSPYGGATAIVLIPSAVLVPAGQLVDGNGIGQAADFDDLGPGRHRRAQFESVASQPNLAPAAGPPQSYLGAPVPAGPPPSAPQRTGGQRWAAPTGTGEYPVFDAPADTHAGLPVRRRGTSMAPSLRAADRRDPVQEPPAAERSPEQARSRMSAMQRGWREGRATDVTEVQYQEPTESS
ncbi:MAG: nitrate- and nitrite sensing domain-containing protein [Streptosporangiaceae bacterium]